MQAQRSENDEWAHAVAPRITPRQIIPVLDANTLEMIGRLSNVSLSGLMILGGETFAYRRMYEVRFELGPGPLTLIELGIELVWSKSGGGDIIASGFATRRIARPMHEHLRGWLDQHRHEHTYSACQLTRDADAPHAVARA